MSIFCGLAILILLVVAITFIILYAKRVNCSSSSADGYNALSTLLYKNAYLRPQRTYQDDYYTDYVTFPGTKVF